MKVILYDTKLEKFIQTLESSTIAKVLRTIDHFLHTKQERSDVITRFYKENSRHSQTRIKVRFTKT